MNPIYNTNSVKLYSGIDKKILDLLEKNPKGLLEYQIAEQLGINRATIHRHLKKLTEALEIITTPEAYFKRQYYIKNKFHNKALVELSIEVCEKSNLPFPKKIPKRLLEKIVNMSYPDRKLTKLDISIGDMKFMRLMGLDKVVHKIKPFTLSDKEKD